MQKLLPICSLVSLLLLSACAAIHPPAPADDYVAPSFRRPDPAALIVMLPPEADEAELQPGIDILKNQLHKQLRAAGYRVVLLEQKNYDTMWAEEIVAVGGIYDKNNGNLRRPEFVRAVGYLVQRVTAETKAALVIHPRLVIRKAALSGSGAVWDGQQRRVPVVGLGDSTMTYDGSVGALSVSLAAYTPNGELVLRTHGGASLPYRVNALESKHELRLDLFARDTELAEAVTLSLAPMLKK
ncbi:hypothetical protein [Undibacterium terreum]|uniref:Lipoprotein n=1 Tax=Undibacterium terreum TaxID=1224302 RepID=A0A916U8E7_9BURK|nr:hypothetical protein [Undibacterium terreum]GGC62999.1 hypothetical protein GCM10011396_07470 [Undibacterium terreum]